MNKGLRIILSFLILISTAGLTVDIHYCGGAVYDIGILATAHNCHNENDFNHSRAEDTQCCQNDCETKHFQIKSLDNYLITSFNSNHGNYVLPSLNVFYKLSDFPFDTVLNNSLFYSRTFLPTTKRVLSLLQVYRL